MVDFAILGSWSLSVALSRLSLTVYNEQESERIKTYYPGKYVRLFKKHLWGIRCLQDPGVNTEKGKESVFRKLPVFLCRFVWAFNRRGRPVHRLWQVFLLAVLCLACGPAADEAAPEPRSHLRAVPSVPRWQI